MIISKIDTYQTPEEIAKKQEIFYQLFEKAKPFYTNKEISKLNKLIEQYMFDIHQIENRAKMRYILSFEGNKSAILKDVEEILNSITLKDFQKEISSYERMLPTFGDPHSWFNISDEQKYIEDYKNFYLFLSQLLQSQIEAFQYYSYPLDEIEEIIEQIASQYYKKPDNFSISKITEIKNLPSINTKKLEKICYPLDKVNSTLWYGFPVGKMKKLKAESDKDAKKGKQASILLLLNFDELDGVRISRTLTIYDKCVWNGIANLKKEGHNVVTTAQIYEAMGNTSKLNARDKKKILESVKVISRARVTIDNTEEAKLYKYDKVAFDTPLLAAEICTAYANGNIVDDAIRIIEMPKLFLFAENRAQITQLPLQVLDSPISKTDDNLLLTDYLITRIARMKNSKYITRTILLDTIHQKCNVKTSKQKQRLPEKIERILKHYKNIGWIKDFKLTNREIEIFTF